MNNDCIFCKIVSKQTPSTIEYEDESVVAFVNIRPIAETHILIAPKKHIETFMDLDNAELALAMIKAAQKLVQEKNILGGYKLVFNGGKYQEIPHVHWHLLGGTMKSNE